MGVTKKNNHFNKLKVNMQRMSNKVKNMRSLLLILFSAISLSVSAQTITLKGNVKDATGEPIIGASVVEKGNTSNGTITDLDGNFSLKVPSKANVIISYIGMKTQDVAVKGQRVFGIICLNDPTKDLIEKVKADDQMRLFEYSISYSEII